jgi:hypothetical protein
VVINHNGLPALKISPPVNLPDESVQKKFTMMGNQYSRRHKPSVRNQSLNGIKPIKLTNQDYLHNLISGFVFNNYFILSIFLALDDTGCMVPLRSRFRIIVH